MWTTIYVATGLVQAKEVKELLTREGFLVRKQYLLSEGDEALYEILVPEFEAKDVHRALFDLGII